MLWVTDSADCNWSPNFVGFAKFATTGPSICGRCFTSVISLHPRAVVDNFFIIIVILQSIYLTPGRRQSITEFCKIGCHTNYSLNIVIWTISIFRFYGNFWVNKFILRFSRQNDIVRFVVVPLRKSMKNARETTLKLRKVSHSRHKYRKTRLNISFTKLVIVMAKKSMYSNRKTRQCLDDNSRPSLMASRLRTRNDSKNGQFACRQR